MLLDFLERFALIEKKSEFVRRERFQSEQIAEAVSQCPHSNHKSVRILKRKATQLFHAVDQHHTLFFVDLPQAHLDDFRVASLDVPSNILGLDGHLTVPTVNQDAQSHAFRPP